MKNKKRSSAQELAENAYTLAKYKLGIEKPPKKVGPVRKYALLGAGAALLAGVVGIFSNKKSRDIAINTAQKTGKVVGESVKEASEKLSSTAKDWSKSTSETARELGKITSEKAEKGIERLNEITKDQIKKVK